MQLRDKRPAARRNAPGFNPQGRPGESTLRQHSTEAESASSGFRWWMLVIGAASFGLMMFLVGQGLHDDWYPYGEFYAALPDCPGSKLRALEFDVLPPDAGEAARAAAFHNWTGVQVRDLGHTHHVHDGSPEGTEVSDWTLPGYCGRLRGT